MIIRVVWSGTKTYIAEVDPERKQEIMGFLLSRGYPVLDSFIYFGDDGNNYLRIMTDILPVSVQVEMKLMFT